MQPEIQKYLNQKEVAEILNVRTQTLNQWRCSHKQEIRKRMPCREREPRFSTSSSFTVRRIYTILALL